MVFYFQPRGYDPETEDYLLYMGEDKFENEHLIKHALPRDVWFHVDAVSSAHVYMRMPRGWSWPGGEEGIPADALEDACQLVKANSIAGNKMSNVGIVYTLAGNLKKTAAMDVGQVGFHDQAAVKKALVAKRINEIVNRLNRTRTERVKPDLEGERLAYERELRGAARAEAEEARGAAQAAAEASRRERELRSYDRLMDPDAMKTGTQIREEFGTAEEYEDNFL